MSKPERFTNATGSTVPDNANSLTAKGPVHCHYLESM
jgi:hypothetical protein